MISCILATKLGSRDSLKVLSRWGLSPWAAQMRWTEHKEMLAALTIARPVQWMASPDGRLASRATGLPRSRVLLDTRLIHDSWRKGCRDERTKARGGFGGGRP